MFIEMTDDEMININYVATIRKGIVKHTIALLSM